MTAPTDPAEPRTPASRALRGGSRSRPGPSVAVLLGIFGLLGLLGPACVAPNASSADRCGPEPDTADTESARTGEAPPHSEGREPTDELPTTATTATTIGVGRGSTLRPWHATPFLNRHLYSYGVALRRDKARTCGALVVANGHDHTPQYAATLSMLTGCTPDPKGTSTSRQALHYADVATADLDGDGRDETLLSALAGPDGQPRGGGILLTSADGAQRWIDRGIAASSLAIGDLDGDGDLDLVAGTYWAPPSDADGVSRASSCASSEPEPPTAAPRVGQLLPRSTHGPVFVYLQEANGTLTRSRRIPSTSPFQLRLADVDLDGTLDLITAGRSVEVIYGPLTGRTDLRCERLTPGQRGAYSTGVDVAHVDAPEGGLTHVLITASEACSTSARCGALERSGVHLWQRTLLPAPDPRHDPPSAWDRSFVEIDGITSALRFASIPRSDPTVSKAPLDLVVGRLTAGTCDEASELMGHCFGAPLLGLRGRWEDDRIRLTERPEPLPLADPRTKPVAAPMASRILPYVSARGAVHLREESRCYGGIAARECGCGECAPLRSRLVTYRGSETVIAVEGVDDSRGELSYDHTYGDAHVSLRRAPEGPVRVRWRLAEHPGFVVTSASPIDIAGPSILIEPRLDDVPPVLARTFPRRGGD